MPADGGAGQPRGGDLYAEGQSRIFEFRRQNSVVSMKLQLTAVSCLQRGETIFERKRSEMGIGTKCVQDGYRPGNGEPRQIPISTEHDVQIRYERGHGQAVRPGGSRATFTRGCRIRRMTTWRPR